MFLDKLTRLAGRLASHGRWGGTAEIPPLRTVCCGHLDDFQRLLASTEIARAEQAACEASLLRPDDPFAVRGTCAVCRGPTEFQVGYGHCFVRPDGTRVPNWREQLLCPGCGLNNRMRAAYQLLQERLGRTGALYLTEQVTPLFRAVSARFGQVVGSEFLRNGTRQGAVDAAGIRHEDLTALTFPDRFFGCIGCFEVLEHIPNHRLALHQLFRCLAPGGTLLATVPFALDRVEHIERAKLHLDGSVEHLLPAEYHGDPLDGAGVLCFRHFGWNLLPELGAAGFRDAALHFYWSRELGHLGGTQVVVMARRPY
jgi:SAM-dependent methyltransferase